MEPSKFYGSSGTFEMNGYPERSWSGLNGVNGVLVGESGSA